MAPTRRLLLFAGWKTTNTSSHAPGVQLSGITSGRLPLVLPGRVLRTLCLPWVPARLLVLLRWKRTGKPFFIRTPLLRSRVHLGVSSVPCKL